jgi:hypothetical protein
MHKVDDLGAREDLIRYAVAGQLARLGVLGVSDRTVGKAVSGGPPHLSHCLAGQPKFSNDVLRQLDEVIVALAPGIDHTGGLAQFAARMRGLTDRTSLVAHIPPNWTRDMLRTPSEAELHVLIQSSALLTNFFAAGRAGRRGQAIRDAYKDSIPQVVDRLLLIAIGPPTPRGVEAQVMLGNLAKYAFGLTFEKLEDVLRYNPLGFRIWRALTKLVLLSKDDRERGDSYLANQVEEPITKLLSEAQDLRTNSIYPGGGGRFGSGGRRRWACGSGPSSTGGPTTPTSGSTCVS